MFGIWTARQSDIPRHKTIMFSLEERFEILKTYFQSQCCVAETVRILKRNMSREKAPSGTAVVKLVKKVRETGLLLDNRSGPRARTVRTPENIEAVARNVRQNPSTSTRRRSQQLAISRTSLRRILHKDLGLFAYKVQMTQELKANDHPLRYQFAVWAIDHLKFDNRIISRFGDVNWPARSCDLTPLDFFLWGAVKDRCYADNPETIPALKHNIATVIGEIGGEIIDKVLQNWIHRMAYCKASRGSHMNEIVFHS